MERAAGKERREERQPERGEQQHSLAELVVEPTDKQIQCAGSERQGDGGFGGGTHHRTGTLLFLPKQNLQRRRHRCFLCFFPQVRLSFGKRFRRPKPRATGPPVTYHLR
eukprot:TRINITY_DN10077_c0_g1_i1.p3 TRINITY_DN10077_c0_g1~~TRINITY_DN10077_c0_g1_i1.p3  ORF type:complete len:109 (-),score=3.89 TRINITY_DN10077_c0_g1_i1:520-846(-)